MWPRACCTYSCVSESPSELSLRAKFGSERLMVGVAYVSFSSHLLDGSDSNGEFIATGRVFHMCIRGAWPLYLGVAGTSSASYSSLTGSYCFAHSRSLPLGFGFGACVIQWLAVPRQCGKYTSLLTAFGAFLTRFVVFFCSLEASRSARSSSRPLSAYQISNSSSCLLA